MKTPDQCFDTPGLTKDEHHALIRLAAGSADEYTQKLALSVIVKKLARTHDQPFVPESDRQTSFLAGRMYVGQQLLKYINNPPKD